AQGGSRLRLPGGGRTAGGGLRRQRHRAPPPAGAELRRLHPSLPDPRPEVIELLHRQGRSYGDFTLLYRTHAQSRAFEEEFVRRGLPYQIVAGLRFYDRKEIKDLLAYLR